MRAWIVWLSLVIASLGLAQPAKAAEPSPAAQWDGLYVGGQVGGAWSDADWAYQNHNWFNTLGPVLVGTDFDLEASGVVAGGQAGFNYQSGNWVLGIEGSATGGNPDAKPDNPIFPSDHYTSEIEWLATVTGRLGYAGKRWLAYGKFGWAGAEIDLNILNQFSGVRAHSSQWANGWTVGGGGEYAFRERLSFAVEYSHAELDIDGWRVSCPTCPSGIGGGVPVVDGDISVESITARLNYHFGN